MSTATLQSYSSLGGSLNPTIDSRGFPFEDSLEVPITIREKRYENYPSLSGLAGITSGTTNNRIEFNINAVSDQSMYNLKESFIEFKLLCPALANNGGLTQFGVDAMVSDIQIYFGSTLVSEPHGGGVLPWQSFMKRMISRPTCGQISGDATNCDLQLDTLEELEFIMPSLGNSVIQTSVATSPLFLTGTKTYVNGIEGGIVTLRYRIQDGVGMTSKYFPANMNLKIVLSVSIAKAFQDSANQISGGAITLSDCQFYLNRVFLTEESLKAQNQAILRTPFKYIVPYSKVETKYIPTGQTFYNTGGLFQGQSKPDLLMMAFQYPVDKTWPSFACGSNVTAGVGNGPKVASLFVKWNGRQYPLPTAQALGSDQRTYQMYVDQCLNDDSPLISYATWLKYYTVYVINLRDDQEKIFGLAPSMETGALELSVNFATATAQACTLYAVALTHAKLEISDSGQITKINYIN